VIEDKNIAATTGSAVGLSALASFVGLCCIGPWAVGFLGVTGAVAMARWQPYRPFILGLAAVLLAWGFWQVYRPARYCPGGVCPTRRSIALQVLLWSAALLLGLAFFADEIQWLLVDPTPKGLRP
jgi:mercuric ion transport protein